MQCTQRLASCSNRVARLCLISSGRYGCWNGDACRALRPASLLYSSRQYSTVLSARPARRTINQSCLSYTTSVQTDDTIFALSTAPGKAAIAIVRCSGPACSQIYSALCPKAQFPQARKAAFRKLVSPSDGSLLDPGAFVLFFPGPSTVTGENVLELHLHGGNATVRAVLASIASLSTESHPIRYAEAGEFTRRAFYNQRLDLTQVEALGDNLAAETEQQRRLAVSGSGSTLAQRYDDWREQLLAARGELEALIDFSEDQHFDESPAELCQSVAVKVRRLVRQLDTSLQNAARGELLRDGIKVALLGAPNVGKSSLLNQIVGREAAIVSSEAGTTRDVVETNVDIGGFFCNFGDLAGLRGPSKGAEATSAQSEIGKVEQEGIRRAKQRALDADVVIVVRACEKDSDGELTIPLPKEVEETLSKCDRGRQRVVEVVNKVDLAMTSDHMAIALRESEELRNNVNNAIRNEGTTTTSEPILLCCTDAAGTQSRSFGVQSLLQRLITTFEEMTTATDIPGLARPNIREDASLGASERQARLLEQCRQELHLFLEAVEVPAEVLDNETEVDIVLAAESLRAAAICLAKITGRGEGGDVEDVLGVVFENFCVGK